MDFSRSISVDASTRTFSFHKINSTKGNRYHITTAGEDGQPYSFDMENNYGRWKIIDAPRVPDWVRLYEEKLVSLLVAAENDAESTGRH